MAVGQFDITSRAPLLAGKSFGKTGPYEVLRGTVTFHADPLHRRNRDITDLDKAPRNPSGLVTWSADLCLLQPADPARSNGRLLFEVLNRGRMLAFRVFDGVTETPDFTRDEHVGAGCLLRQGYTLVWCGWQWDVVRQGGMMGAEVPEAMDDGQPLSGKVRCQWWPNAPAQELLLADRVHHPLPAMAVDDPEAILTVRDYENGPRQVIPRQAWHFGRVDGEHVVPDPTHVAYPDGFTAGKVYECVYRTNKAPVVGLGLLTVRDVVACLRSGDLGDQHPCTSPIERAYGFGVSQSGRFLRHFLYLNLNTDEAERQVFDGFLVHVAGARRGEFDYRFAQPSANTMQSPNTVFPFTDAEQTDPLTGARDGLLNRLAQEGPLPKIMHVNTSAEYWRGECSLGHIAVDGSGDVSLPEAVRLYLFAGTQHIPAKLPLSGTAGDGAQGQHALNSLDYTPLLRAALTNLDAWVSRNEPPPPSQYPRLTDGTAVPASRIAEAFAAIPESHFPTRLPQPHRLDFGPEWSQGVVTILPPRLGEPYATYVPAVDHDGNEIAGIRHPDLTVPLATYTGWNPRHPDQGAPEQPLRMHGGLLPFAVTKEARTQRGDPRLSIAERYASRAAYLEAATKAAEALVAARYLLAEDIEPVIQRAAQRYDLLTARV